MLEELIFQKLWIILPVWLAVYLADYYLTILGAYYYKTGACEHIVYEGSYELTPAFQPDVDALRMVSPKFILWVLISSAIIVLLWFASHMYPSCIFFFRFLFGGLILHEIVILSRHIRNIALFRSVRNHGGISGHIRYEKWLSYHISAIELLSFAVVFMIVYLFTGSDSLLGGSVLVATTGLKHLEMSRKTIERNGPKVG